VVLVVLVSIQTLLEPQFKEQAVEAVERKMELVVQEALLAGGREVEMERYLPQEQH
jgi:cation transport ATPase